jgi:hypothetical protein
LFRRFVTQQLDAPARQSETFIFARGIIAGFPGDYVARYNNFAPKNRAKVVIMLHIRAKFGKFI